MVNVYLIGHGFVWLNEKHNIKLIAPMKAYVDEGVLLDGFGLASLIDNGLYEWQGHARRAPVAQADHAPPSKWGDPLAQKPPVERMPSSLELASDSADPPPPPPPPDDLLKGSNAPSAQGGGNLMQQLKGPHQFNVAAAAAAREALVPVHDPHYHLFIYAKGDLLHEHLLVTDEDAETRDDLGREGTKGEGDRHAVCQKYVRAKADPNNPRVVFRNDFGTLIRTPRLQNEPANAPEETCIYQTKKKILTRLSDIQREVCLVFPEQHKRDQITLHWAACRDKQHIGNSLSEVFADIKRQGAIGIDGYVIKKSFGRSGLVTVHRP